MTTPELLWMVHEENVRYLYEHEQHKLRKYLISMGDEAELRAFDQQKMKSKSSSGRQRR